MIKTLRLLPDHEIWAGPNGWCFVLLVGETLARTDSSDIPSLMLCFCIDVKQRTEQVYISHDLRIGDCYIDLRKGEQLLSRENERKEKEIQRL